MSLLWTERVFTSLYSAQKADGTKAHYERAGFGNPGHVHSPLGQYSARAAYIVYGLDLGPRPRVLVAGCGFNWTGEEILRLCPEAEVWGFDNSPFIHEKKVAESGVPETILDEDIVASTRFGPGAFDLVVAEDLHGSFADDALPALMTGLHRFEARVLHVVSEGSPWPLNGKTLGEWRAFSPGDLWESARSILFEGRRLMREHYPD